MACMCVPPSLLVATPWLVPILLRPLVKVRGSSPRRGSSPLLIVLTPKGWKAEYTLASRMQIHESLTVLALLTRGEARTSDPWICSLMLYHLSYLTTYIHTYIHTYIYIRIYPKYKYTIVPIIVGALGTIPKKLKENLQKTGIKTEKIPTVTKEIQKLALLGTLKVCKNFQKIV